VTADPSIFETALLHHRVGRLAEAERLYRQVLAVEPNHPQAMFHLGVLALQAARLDDAVAIFTRAIALVPNNAACHANLGEAQRRSGRFAEAVDSFLRAMDLNADFAEPVYGLALTLLERGAIDGALACFRRAADLKPDLADVRARLTAAQATADEREKTPRDRSSTDDQDRLSAKTLMALARPLALKGRFQEAAGLLERVVELQPRMVAAHCNLGVVYGVLGQGQKAAASYRRALEIEPDMADAHHNLGNALLRSGLLDEAISSFRNAAAVSPKSAPYHSDLVFHLHFHPAYDSRSILAEARAWDLAHAAPLRAQEAERGAPRSAVGSRRDCAPERRLRVGYVSPNFRQHCQAFFMFPVLSHHDHEKFEIFCYSDVARPDDWTRELLSHADQSRHVVGIDDAALADLVRDDRIDVLVDLTMHMAGGRLLVFARRAAPVQLCWLAYPGTTGLAAMDYRLTDPYLDPPGADPDAYAEHSLRLPDTFWCYDPRAHDDGISPLPAKAKGYIRLGCLNNFLKVNEAAIALWARVMREVDASRLTLLAPVGDARKRTLDAFEAHGVDRARVDFVEYQARLPYLATYRSIDVCLDTFPYNGHTTSLDAFWMGVPVVTLVGSTVVGRAGLCQAKNLGLPELVSRTPDEYVNVAVGLCKDLERLSELRAGLRTRMELSPLMDAPRFTRNLEAVYRSTWKRWCDSHDSE
jgi:predicted O-linked N-acetylglucosamine transferase (SPINDLY family)